MVNVNFGACVSNYWFVWSISGLGSIFGLAINMAISFFFLKYFHNIEGKMPSAPKRPKSNFGNIGSSSPAFSTSAV